jgi:hypothetical protein
MLYFPSTAKAFNSRARQGKPYFVEDQRMLAQIANLLDTSAIARSARLSDRDSTGSRPSEPDAPRCDRSANEQPDVVQPG